MLWKFLSARPPKLTRSLFDCKYTENRSGWLEKISSSFFRGFVNRSFELNWTFCECWWTLNRTMFSISCRFICMTWSRSRSFAPTAIFYVFRALPKSRSVGKIPKRWRFSESIFHAGRPWTPFMCSRQSKSRWKHLLQYRQ